MSEPLAAGPVAVLAGGGDLPPLVAAAMRDQGRAPVVFAIAGEADAERFEVAPVHILRWGEIGRMFRLLDEAGCREAVFVGSIRRRPDFKALRPDFGAMKLVPRIVRLMRSGDDGLLGGVAAIFAEQGVALVSPLDVAPALAMPEGIMAGKVGAEELAEVCRAAEAARLIGRLDVGQSAVAAGGRVVALEDAGGTDKLLQRLVELRAEGRIDKAGGVLVKCMKPQQDRRLDVPTIGPDTARKARQAGLSGVAAEAGRALLAGRDETIAAFREAGLFLLGIAPPAPEPARGHG